MWDLIIIIYSMLEGARQGIAEEARSNKYSPESADLVCFHAWGYLTELSEVINTGSERRDGGGGALSSFFTSHVLKRDVAMQSVFSAGRAQEGGSGERPRVKVGGKAADRQRGHRGSRSLGSAPSANSGRKSLKGKPTHRPSVTTALAPQPTSEWLQ